MLCCHPRLNTLPRGLLSALGSFRELESRIASLGEELQRGDAFRVFIEAYLKTRVRTPRPPLALTGRPGGHGLASSPYERG